MKPNAYGRMTTMKIHEAESGRVDVTVTVVFYQANDATRELLGKLVGLSMRTVITETEN